MYCEMIVTGLCTLALVKGLVLVCALPVGIGVCAFILCKCV